MRKNLNQLYLILIIVTIFSHKIFGQWELKSIPYKHSYYSIYFIDSLHGFLGGNGFLLKTNDSGENWDSLKINYTPEGFYFFNQNKGFCITTDGAYFPQSCIYKTTNGGKNWNISNSGNLILSSIVFTDSLHGIVTGFNYENGSVLLKTGNGGDSWELSKFEKYKSFRFLKMITDSIGYIAAADSEAVILRTTDGGNNWTEGFRNKRSELFNKIEFADSLHGLVAGYANALFRTIDGGNSWEQIFLPLNAQVISIKSFKNKSWILLSNTTGVYSKKVLYSSDYGASWISTLQIDNVSYMTDMYFIDDHNGWVTGYATYNTTNGGFNNLLFPLKPILYSPRNDTLSHSDDIIFLWSEEDFAFYRLQVSLDSIFSDLIFDSLFMDNGGIVYNLSPNKTYYLKFSF